MISPSCIVVFFFASAVFVHGREARDADGGRKGGREGGCARKHAYTDARGRARASEKQRYQRRASKTISCVSWVICHPAFFRLQSGRCVLENCKWESAGCAAVGGGRGERGPLGERVVERGEREGENLIPLISADTGPV